MVEVAYRRT